MMMKTIIVLITISFILKCYGLKNNYKIDLSAPTTMISTALLNDLVNTVIEMESKMEKLEKIEAEMESKMENMEKIEAENGILKDRVTHLEEKMELLLNKVPFSNQNT